MKKKQRRRLFGLALLAIAALGLGLAYLLGGTRKEAPEIKLYFYRGEELTMVRRPLSPDRAPLEQALEALLSGPNGTERAAGLQTMIPPGTKALSAKTEKGTAAIVFNRRLEAYGGGSSRVEGMIDQIVYTITEVPGVKSVWIKMAGEQELVLGGEGLVIDKPLSRADLRR